MSRPNPRRIVPVVLLLALIALAFWWRSQQSAAANGPLAASGTIEGRQVTVAAEIAGHVADVQVQEGDSVASGDELVRLDTATLDAQQAQAKASLRAVEAQRSAAEAGVAAADANLALLQAGASEEQRAVADSAVARAEEALTVAEALVATLPESAQGSAQGLALQQQVALAQATLDTARAQRDQVDAGPRPQQVDAAKAQVQAATGQLEAVTAQVEAAQAALDLLAVQRSRATIRAPLDGVVTTRAIEPGELALPGSTLLQVVDLSALTLTVYVPEDRYGAIGLGDSVTVTVDSLPDRTFSATVQRIADRAEFTPRNVQTAEGRRNTVYAITLQLVNDDGALKPGMPADVVFER